VDDYSVDELRQLGDQLRNQNLSKTISAVFSRDSKCDRVMVIINVSQDVQSKYQADKLLMILMSVLVGHGGGNAASAQGGGTEKTKIQEAIDQISTLIK
jgi:alanyl-tRNA synthetase